MKMKYVNEVHIVGTLSDTPVLRAAGASDVVNMRIKTVRTFKGRDGEVQTPTWHSVVAWNEAARAIDDAGLSPGDWIEIRGTLQTRRWEGSDGKARYKTEVRADHVHFESDGAGPAKRAKSDAGAEGYEYGSRDCDVPF